MSQLIPFIPLIGGALGLTGSLLGGQDQVNPEPLPPMFPDLNFAMGRFLSNQFDSSSGEPVPYGVAPYPGQLSPDINQTRLPEVYGNWQPWNAGNSAMAQFVANPGIGQQDPRLANMMQYGGTGGVGNQMMSLAAQYGAPSQAGQAVSSTAQFGAPSQSMANLLNPFLTGQGGPGYRPPPIPTRQVGRNA